MYLPLMEQSQLITILFLIVGLLGLGLIFLSWLALRNKPGQEASPSESTGQIQFERDQALLRVEALQAELLIVQKAEREAIEMKSRAEQKLEDFTHQEEQRKTTLKQEFDILARTIIEENAERHNQQLTKEGKETLKAALTPIQEKFTELQKQMKEFYGDEREQLGQLDKELGKLFSLNQSLQEEAKNLTNALKGESKVQGDWGEYQLERILEQVGLVEGVHFSKQSTVRNEEGKLLRPDFLIYLPDQKVLVIDSKVSLTAYERMMQAEDPEMIKSERNAHERSVLAHIKALGEKNYAEQYGKSTDYTLMFVPIEAAWVALGEKLPGVQEEGLRRNVLLVSTSTLIATLRTISYVWKQEEQRINIQKIAERGAKLYDKLRLFTDSMLQIGNRLDQAKVAYEQALGRLSGPGGAIRQAELMRELGVAVKTKIAEELTGDSDEERFQITEPSISDDPVIEQPTARIEGDA